MLGTSKHTGASPALMSSLSRSGLRELEEALGRLFPWSLWGRGKHTALSTKAKWFSFCVNSRLNAISEETTEPCLWNGVWCSYYRILITLWFSAEIYLLKTSQICLTIQNMVTRNNKINPKFTAQTKKTDEGSIPQEVTVTIRKNSAVLELKKPSFQKTSFSHTQVHTCCRQENCSVRSDEPRNHTGGSNLEPRFNNVRSTALSTKSLCLQSIFEN